MSFWDDFFGSLGGSIEICQVVGGIGSTALICITGHEYGLFESSSNCTSEDPESSTIGCSVLGSVLGTGFSYADGPEIGPFWQDSSGGWHVGDDLPYSRVEQKAQQVFDYVSGKATGDMDFPAVVAESVEAYEAIKRLGGGTSPDLLIQNMTILEAAIKLHSKGE